MTILISQNDMDAKMYDIYTFDKHNRPYLFGVIYTDDLHVNGELTVEGYDVAYGDHDYQLVVDVAESTEIRPYQLCLKVIENENNMIAIGSYDEYGIFTSAVLVNHTFSNYVTDRNGNQLSGIDWDNKKYYLGLLEHY
jgi:hypothetical protein